MLKECNAECIKIEPHYQQFKTDHQEEHCKIINLSGWQRASVNVGDKGIMRYETNHNKSQGYWRFYRTIQGEKS